MGQMTQPTVSFIKKLIKAANIKMTARTPNNIKQKDGIRGTRLKQVVMCGGYIDR